MTKIDLNRSNNRFYCDLTESNRFEIKKKPGGYSGSFFVQIFKNFSKKTSHFTACQGYLVKGVIKPSGKDGLYDHFEIC